MPPYARVCARGIRVYTRVIRAVCPWYARVYAGASVGCLRGCHGVGQAWPACQPGLAWPGLSMHQFCAADLSGLGAIFGAGSYAGLSGLKKRLVGPFPWLGAALLAAWHAGAGAGAGAMTIFTVYINSTGQAYRIGLACYQRMAKPRPGLRWAYVLAYD